jgi:curved DNA-binding protein CbpA
MAQIKTFYDELGVARNATVAEIKRAFKEVAKIYHPDKNPPEKQAWAHEQMSRFNFILETLTNPATRTEYDELVKKYEAEPVVPRPRRRPREQNAIEREYAQVSVEIMNIAGRYANCRLKIAIGATIGTVGAILHLVGYSTSLLAGLPIVLAFSYFFALIGGVMTVFGIADYLGRNQYRQRLDELEARQAFLRQRMFEAYVGY